MSGPSELALLLAALALDLALGEPPRAIHPVVWMGKAAAAAERFAVGPPARQLLAGALLALGLPALFALGGSWLVGAVLPGLAALVGVWLLKSTFALRALGRAARGVREPLEADDLPRAREGLRSLCSRDPAHLEAPALAGATVSSLAENASDSFVAPLFYYAVAGIPGALFYRAVNTLDAMIGYHGRFEHFGKAAARLDDLLNLIPARLTAGLLLAAGALTRGPVGDGWRILRRDGGKTASPNGGRPMAAMAGLLGVTLEKAEHYRLGDGPAPGTATIGAAWRLVRIAAALAAAGTAVTVLAKARA